MFTNLTQRKLFSGSIFFSGSAFLFYAISEKKKYEETNWLELKKMAQSDNIKKVELHNSRKAIIYPSKELNKIYHIDISDNNFAEKKLDKFDKNIIVEHKNHSFLSTILLASIPTLLLMGGFFYLFKRNTNNSFSIFKNEFKIIEEKLGVKISDIAGLHETKKDVLEFTDIIMNSEKYLKMGTKIPTGLLMEGPPGTGKTMLAKAVADNYSSKFFLINGSDFIQPIIGTGSKKVKELFETARKNSPAIIFIDEIDAVGKSRNVSKSVGNDERDNILNSLLVEMDGFNQNEKVLVMGATNRSDVLDPALLRPGRFDRVINFELPNLEERRDILSLYYEKYNVCEKIIKEDLIDNLAKLTYGFNGAQLQNLFNEASIRAIRHDRESIDNKDFDDSIEYVLMGNKKTGYLSDQEKEIISFHEAGHALVSYLLKNVPSPNKVSIIPRSKGALGFSQSIPETEKKLHTENEMKEQIMVMMGGRVAEEIVFKDVTNGASDDIKRLNQLAKSIIGTFGMSKNFRMKDVDLDTRNNLWRKESDFKINNFDKEVDALIDTCYTKTVKLLNDNLIFLKGIQKKLIVKETIYYNDIDKIYKSLN